ncbi:MAG: phosphoribosylamine--glycine ligase, partial [Clostridia bacterium]|nr:phosphoribosylamine--glycine ligase [Deltaproteobacteria bacterium]
AIAVGNGLATEDRWLDHAGTRMVDGMLVTCGGRIAAVVARGSTMEDARKNAYDGVKHVCFDGMQYRNDIAHEVST